MRFSNKLIAIIVSLVIISIAGLFFLVGIKNVSIDDQTAEYSAFDVMDTSKVFVNQYGFPHIVANSENDMFFSLGFVHAKERLWQMDFSRRAGRGRLAEIMGADALPFDLFIRSLNIASTVSETKDVLSAKSKAVLEAYSKGVNFYIENNKNKLSFEFGALDYMPEKWTTEDCLIVSKMMAFELSLSFFYDVAFGEMAEKIGMDKAKGLIPGYPDNSPFVLDDAVKNRNYEIVLKDTVAVVDSTKIDTSKVDVSFDSGFSEYINEMREYIGIKGSSIGSNAWARRKNADPKSTTVFANDPHLPLSMPARWFPAHATCPGFNVVGFMVPGIPMFISGRNDDIAWGITNVMLDDCDYFVEQLDKSGKYYFNADSSKHEIKYITDTIKVKNGVNHVYYKRYTERGQIVSDAHIFNRNMKSFNKKVSNKYLKSHALTCKWTGNAVNDDIYSMYRINKAKNWLDFTTGTNSWSAPALNFTYSDKRGNIGIAPSGYVPIREADCNPNFPNKANQKNTGWSGIAKSGFFPKIYNPTKGFVASANNKTGGGIEQYITSHWEPPSRIERIEELIQASEEFSSRDAQYMQSDYYSMYAKQHFTYIIPVFEEFKHLFKGKEIEAYKKLKRWDFVMTQNSPAASIYNAFMERLIYNTFHDDLGGGYYYKYLLISNLALRKIMEISGDPHNEWFNDAGTSRREKRDFIFVKSFKDAVWNLKEQFATEDINKWKWGKLHTLTIKHRFSDNQFMKPTVTVGPLGLGGNSTTLNNTEYRISEPYNIYVGASMRFVADMSENVVYMSLPGGVSGDPLSPNYSNLVQIWLNGGYLKIPFTKEPSKNFGLSIVLAPKI